MAVLPKCLERWGWPGRPGAGQPGAGVAGRILLEKIGLMYGRFPVGLGLSLTVAAAMTFFLPIQGGRRNLLLWGAANLLLGALRAADWMAYQRQPRALAAGSRRHGRLVLGAAAQGVLWGILGWFLFPSATLDQLLLTLVMTGMAGVSLVFLSPLQAAYALYLIPVMFPLCLHLMGGALAMQRIAGGLGLAYITAMLYTSAKVCRWIEESLRSAIENEDLVRRLAATNTDLLQSMNEGFGRMDEHDRFLFANRAAEKIFRVPAGTLAGRALADFLDPAGAALVQHETGQRRLGKSNRYVCPINLPDGEQRLLQMNVSPTRDPDGKFTGTFAVFEDITELKRAEEELREANQFKGQIIRCVRQGVVVHGPDLRYQVWNPYMEELSGLSEREVLGRHPLELFPFFKGAGVIERLERALAGESVDSLDFPYHLLKTGRSGWANDSASPMYDAKGQITGVIVVVREITERKLAEAALRESEERYRTQFELSTEGILALSTSGEILQVNEAFARMHGYTREEILKMKLEDLDTAESYAHAEERMRSILAGAEPTFEVEHRHKDGHAFPLEVSAGIISAGGRAIILNYHRDITERKSAEREKEELQARLLQAQKMESLGVLAGGVAHDMNNVLGAILGIASASLETLPAGSPARQAFGTVANAAERGGKMVKSLLNFARRSPAEEREIDLNDLLREEVGLLERTTLSRIRLELDLAAGLRPIRGDASALANAFMNVFVNAMDAMEGGGTLTIRTRNLDGGRIEAQVEDTGTGMPREVLEKALDPFFTTKEIGKGTGLGLSMVYGAVKAHQGRLEIRSQPGQGTCVAMVFPACPERRADGVAEPAPAAVAAGGLKVLLVDDDELIQEAMQAMLEVLGHRVASARSGEEAMDMLDFDPDVMILDMNMPGLGGAGTLARFRALRPRVPVILATGRADQATLDLVEAHPRVTLLSKPFTMRELEQRLQRVE